MRNFKDFQTVLTVEVKLQRVLLYAVAYLSKTKPLQFLLKNVPLAIPKKTDKNYMVRIKISWVLFCIIITSLEYLDEIISIKIA